MDGVAANDPVGYPGSSDPTLAKFPPTLFVTGTRALDMSAAITSHARLLKLGVDSSLYVMEGGWHAASYGTRGSPEEVDVNTYIGRWFDQHLSK
jgi:acetyl esterase/lipase